MPITHLPISTSRQLPLTSHPSPLTLSTLTLTLSPSLTFAKFPLETNANSQLQLIDTAKTKWQTTI